MDVLASAGLFRVPIVIEYDDLKTLQLNAVTESAHRSLQPPPLQ